MNNSAIEDLFIGFIISIIFWLIFLGCMVFVAAPEVNSKDHITETTSNIVESFVELPELPPPPQVTHQIEQIIPGAASLVIDNILHIWPDSDVIIHDRGTTYTLGRYLMEQIKREMKREYV